MIKLIKRVIKMESDITNLFKEKNKSILLTTLKYDIEKNITSVLETMVNIFNNEFDTAITKVTSIYEDSGSTDSKKYITDTINRMKLDSYKEVEKLLNDKKVSLESILEQLDFTDERFQEYYDAVSETTEVLKNSLKKYCIEEVQKDAIFSFKENIENTIEEEKQSLALSRVEDYFTVRLYGKLESKLYMELELRDNNLLNKAREGYIRYHQIVEKTEERGEVN